MSAATLLGPNLVVRVPVRVDLDHRWLLSAVTPGLTFISGGKLYKYKFSMEI